MWAALLATGLSLVLDLRDVELSQIVDQVSRETGETVLFDPSLSGRVTIIAEDEVSPAEAREILQAALLLSGFAMVPGPGGAQKVLPLETALQEAPFGPPLEGEGDRLLVTLLRLEAADARSLQTTLRTLVGRGLVFAHAPSNSLILATTQSRVARLLAIIRALDQAAATELRVLALRYADAASTAAQIEATFPAEQIGPRAYRVIPDARTNALIVEGSAGRVRDIEGLLRTLDVPTSGRGELHVVRIVNADAEILAEKLNALRGGQQGEDPLAGQDYDIVADAPTNSLLIRSTPYVFGIVSEVISELDRQPPRVALDVSIFQVETSTSLQLGFDALIPLLVPDAPGDAAGVTLVGSLASLAAGADVDPGNFIARVAGEPIVIPFVDENGVIQNLLVPKGAAQLRAAQGEATLLSVMQPHLLAASGDEQRIFAGENIPIPETGAGGAEDAFVTSLAIRREDVGIDLRVTPLVREDNVELDLAITLSAVAPVADAVATTSGFGELEDALTPPQTAQGPILSKLELQAKIHLVDGAVAMVASAPRENSAESVAGVPWLSQIPILGNLFKSTSTSTRRSSVLILTQATIVSTSADDRAETLLRRLALERQLARTRPLSTVTQAPYALLVTTRTSRADAEEVAAALSPRGPAEIVEWRLGEEARFDVYLVGFFELPEMGATAIALRRAGYRPKMTVVLTD